MLLQSESSDSQFGGILAVLKVMGWPDITDKILNSDKFMGIDCSQEMVGEQCKAQPVCCEDNYFVGVFLTTSIFLTMYISRVVHWPLAARTSIFFNFPIIFKE